MTKLLCGLFATMTCVLMACSGGEGPAESDPTQAASTTSDTASAHHYMYACSDGPAPCSYDEYVAIAHSASFDRSNGKFTNKFGETCNLIQMCDDCSYP